MVEWGGKGGGGRSSVPFGGEADDVEGPARVDREHLGWVGDCGYKTSDQSEPTMPPTHLEKRLQGVRALLAQHALRHGDARAVDHHVHGAPQLGLGLVQPFPHQRGVQHLIVCWVGFGLV